MNILIPHGVMMNLRLFKNGHFPLQEGIDIEIGLVLETSEHPLRQFFLQLQHYMVVIVGVILPSSSGVSLFLMKNMPSRKSLASELASPAGFTGIVLLRFARLFTIIFCFST